MAEVSTKLILDGISLALHGAFPSSKIVCENIKQGLYDGDMLITLISANERDDIANRKNRYTSFDIAYFGASHEANIEAVDGIISALRIITLPGGDRIRGTNLSTAHIDDVMHVTVSYDYRAYTPEDFAEKMTVLEVYTDV